MNGGLGAVAIFGLAVAGGSAAAPPAHAADDRAAVVKSLSDCRKLTGDARRLACYDKAAAGLDEAQTRGDIVVVDRARAIAAHREAFGLPVPSLDFITRALKPDETNSVTGIVSALRADPNGRWTFSLKDGAVWRQIDGDLFHPPHAGSQVRIRKAAIGSFMMNVDGQPAIRVHRDQ